MKVGLIGLGNMGKNHHRVYSRIKAIEEVAIYDPNIPNHSNLEKFNKLVYEGELKGISVCNPTSFHVQTVLDLFKLNQNLFVLLEKPVALMLEDAKKLFQYSDRILVGHIERHNPAIRHVKNMIDNGFMGEIYSIRTQRVGLYAPSQSNPNVAVDLLVHDVDIVNYLLNDSGFKCRNSFKSYNSTTGLHSPYIDFANISCEYSNKEHKNVSAFCEANWVTPHRFRKLFITASSGYYEVDYIQQHISLYDSSERFHKTVFSAREEPLKNELEHFIKVIRGAEKPICTVEDGAECLGIVNG
jgi:UDP-N-acetylglucosamine 3-dehydrogenase